MSLWLAKNQQSNEVVALQNALNMRLQPAKPLLLDGIFGDHTEDAVKEFQKCEKFKTDGIAGPQTLGALFERAQITRTIHYTALDAGEVRMRTASPYAPPDPFERPRPGSLASMRHPYLDATLRRWLEGEQPSQAWLSQAAPKVAYPLPPPLPAPAVEPSPGHRRNTKPPAPRPMPPCVIPKKLSLHPRQPTATGACFSHEWFEFEVANETEYKPIKEFETTFVFALALVRISPIITPSASLFVTPDRRWGVRGQIEILKRPFLEHEFGRLTSRPGTIAFEPELIGSVAWEKELRRHAQLDFTAGLRLQAQRAIGRIGRHKFSVVWGLSLDAVLGNEEKLQGLSAGPSFAGQITAKVGVNYALEVRKRHH